MAKQTTAYTDALIRGSPQIYLATIPIEFQVREFVNVREQGRRTGKLSNVTKEELQNL